jgi:hypothetical protein
MIQHLEWRSLENRRKDARLALFYKIEHGKVAIGKEGRLTRPRRTTRNTHDKSYMYLQPTTNKDCRKYSFFPSTIKDWNSLPSETVSAPSLEAFKALCEPIRSVFILILKFYRLHTHIHGRTISRMMVAIIEEKQNKQVDVTRISLASFSGSKLRLLKRSSLKVHSIRSNAV